MRACSKLRSWPSCRWPRDLRYFIRRQQAAGFRLLRVRRSSAQCKLCTLLSSSFPRHSRAFGLLGASIRDLRAIASWALGRWGTRTREGRSTESTVAQSARQSRQSRVGDRVFIMPRPESLSPHVATSVRQRICRWCDSVCPVLSCHLSVSPGCACGSLVRRSGGPCSLCGTTQRVDLPFAVVTTSLYIIQLALHIN